MSAPVLSRTLLAAGATALVLCGPAAATTAEAAPAQASASGMVRVGHLSPEVQAVDVQLTSLASSSTTGFPDIGYGELSEYVSVPAGRYSLVVRPDDQAQAPPMVTARVVVEAGGAVTLALSGPADDVTAKALSDDLTPPPPGQARVRLLQGAQSAATVDVVAVDGPRVADDVSFGSATGYANVPAGPWRLMITPSGGAARPATTDVVLAAGSVQTVLALQQGSDLVARVVVDAESMRQMPSGGVQTGFGPGQQRDADTPAAALLLLAGAAVALVAIRPERVGRATRLLARRAARP